MVAIDAIWNTWKLIQILGLKKSIRALRSGGQSRVRTLSSSLELDQNWINGPELNRNRIRAGPKIQELNQNWTRTELELELSWTAVDRDLDQLRARIGSKVFQNSTI